VRYKQTAIGVVWAILQPFLTMVVFSVVFGQFIHVPTGETPYPVFAYTALLPWTFFAGAISQASNSLVYDANLVSKIYFPRLILPLAAVLSRLVDFGFSFMILIGMMLVLKISLGILILTLPLFLLLALLTALGVSLWLSALHVKYRDVGYIIPFLIQIWFFLTPVAYPSTLISARWQFLYGLNPMVGVVEGFRWALLGQQNLSWNLMLYSILLIAALCIGGVIYFRRTEFEFADVV
jgi:lipopolysaccharide transport system permease protein